MRALVTGGAGFIGSTLVDRLLRDGHDVVILDNLSTGRQEFLADARTHQRCLLVIGDLLDGHSLAAAMTGCDAVFHLAANADVRFGPEHPRRDLEQNTLATFAVLDTMRTVGVRRVTFASTGSVYGDASIVPTPEDAPFPVQTSFYGASKLAGEALIAAHAAAFGIEAVILRFVSVLGPRYSHGHVFDFCRQLRQHPERLEVLGNGRQRKSYMHVDDCIAAVIRATERATPGVRIYNVGTDGYCEVRDSARWICERLGVSPAIAFGEADRGWVGDSPFIYLDSRQLRALGWTPSYAIRESVHATVDYLQANPWLFEGRT